jgi:ribosome-associated toxin RatA of RatAB toxin-antitoxin module
VLAAIIDVGCAADRAWALLADVAQTPAWVPGIAEARVIEGDAARPEVVQFGSMPSTGSLEYRLRYTYDDAARTLRWAPVGSDPRGLEGEARVEALDGGGCRLHYQLRTWAGRSVPRWAQAALEGDTAQRTVEAFRRWAESPTT